MRIEPSNHSATKPYEKLCQFFNIYEKNLKIVFLKFKNKNKTGFKNTFISAV